MDSEYGRKNEESRFDFAEHEELNLLVSTLDKSLALGRSQFEPFGLTGVATLQGIAEALLISRLAAQAPVAKRTKVRRGEERRTGFSTSRLRTCGAYRNFDTTRRRQTHV